MYIVQDGGRLAALRKERGDPMAGSDDTRDTVRRGGLPMTLLDIQRASERAALEHAHLADALHWNTVATLKLCEITDKVPAAELAFGASAGRHEALRQVLAHVEEELGYEDGEPSTERPGRWTFTAGATALVELRTWLLAQIGGDS
jgi:hypothetical protein